MTEELATQSALDQRTIEAALAGDAAAQRALSVRLGVVQHLLKAINRRAGHPLTSHELEDVGQDVTTTVWQKLRLFRGVGTLETWLYRFCVFEFRNRCRREAHRNRHVEPLPNEPAGRDAPPDDEIEPDELQSALNELGPPAEPILRLKHERGLSFEAIAKQLGIPSSTAKTRYYEGIRWLRQRLLRGRRS
jgi:RNA polymerase sigma factor (sigma-70 family)